VRSFAWNFHGWREKTYFLDIKEGRLKDLSGTKVVELGIVYQTMYIETFIELTFTVKTRLEKSEVRKISKIFSFWPREAVFTC
jgi:hypothetical protein